MEVAIFPYEPFSINWQQHFLRNTKCGAKIWTIALQEPTPFTSQKSNCLDNVKPPVSILWSLLLVPDGKIIFFDQATFNL